MVRERLAGGVLEALGEPPALNGEGERGRAAHDEAIDTVRLATVGESAAVVGSGMGVKVKPRMFVLPKFPTSVTVPSDISNVTSLSLKLSTANIVLVVWSKARPW